MADEDKKESQVPAAEGAPAPGGGGGLVGKLLGIVLPTVFAGAAAFAGAKFGGGHAAPAHEETPKAHDEKKVPGLTIELKAFIINVTDEKTGENKPLKMSIAIELQKLAKKEEFEPFIPRIRDTVFSYVRQVSYQEVMKPRTKDRMTEDLLGLIHKLGAESATRVLVQEMVTQ